MAVQSHTGKYLCSVLPLVADISDSLSGRFQVGAGEGDIVL